MIEKIISWLQTNKKEVWIFLLFFCIALVSVLYSLTLPFTIHGDTYVTLLANKVALDPNYPDRELLLNLDFKPYLYTNILSFLLKYFSLFAHKFILLFFLVLGTGYFAYLALRMLGFSRSISVLTAIVALMPRGGITGGIFGVFVADDVLGNAFGITFIWLLLAWFIKRRFEKKSLWPVFFVSGLVTYIHPVSVVFFTGLMFVIALIWIIKDKNYKQDIKDFFYSIVAFCLSASLLLTKILFVTKSVASPPSELSVFSASEYVDALIYRVGWDFFPQSAVYALPFFIINLVFILALIYVCFSLYKKTIQKGSTNYFVAQFSFIIIGLSVFFWLFIPNFELWLVKNFDFPFIVQQSSRFFQYYYFGIFLLWAVAMTLLFEKIKKNKKLFYTGFLIIGLFSSTLGFEVFQYMVGYYGYQKEYIPNFIQNEKLVDTTKIYPVICQELKDAGVTRETLVISVEFHLRYWCEIKIFTTFEEGTVGLMAGKEELVR